MKYSKEYIDDIRLMASKGMTIREIATKLNKNHNSMGNLMRAHGIKAHKDGKLLNPRQIQFTDKLYDRMIAIASERQIPISQFVREAVSHYLDHIQNEQSKRD